VSSARTDATRDRIETELTGPLGEMGLDVEAVDPAERLEHVTVPHRGLDQADPFGLAPHA
jgi:hypothetical protein